MNLSKKSLCKQGCKNPMFGKKHSKETCQKISNALQGKQKTLEHCNNISKSLKGLFIQENHPGWKGGKPKCIDCGILLSSYESKRCRKCNYIYLKIHPPNLNKPHSEETKKKISIANKGRKKPPFTKEHIEKIRLSKLGNKNPRYGKHLTDKERIRLNEGRKNYKHSEEALEKIRQSKIGIKNPNWKGGVTLLIEQIRYTLEYKKWVKAIFQRDYYICQDCFKKSNYIHAHHIKSFSIILQEFLQIYSQFSPIEDKETLVRLAITYEPFWDLDNGQTLCIDCHNKTKLGRNIILKK